MTASRAVKKSISAINPPRLPWLIIINILSLSNEGRSPHFFRCSMRSLPAFLALMFVLAASAASADSRVFIIANQADGYGVDQCLAMGEKMRRLRRPLLLPVARFRAGVVLPARRSQ